MTTEATPGALGSNDKLGLAPERAADGEWEAMADLVPKLTACETNGDYMKVLLDYRYRLRTVALAEGAAAERERCAMRLEQAAAEYIASATENKYLTAHGRALMTSASDWAQTMAGALRAMPGPNVELSGPPR